MSMIAARTELRRPEFGTAWLNEATQTVLSIVYLGDRDLHFAFNSAADARAVAAECIKAAEAMEAIEVTRTSAPAVGEGK